MTDFATTVPVAQALWPAAESFLDQKMNWQATKGNQLQELVVDLKDQSLDLAKTLTITQLSSRASNVVKVVNDYLREQEFSIQLEDCGTTNMIYAASVLKLLGKFLVPGKNDYWLNEIRKPAFRLSKEAGVKHFQYNGQTVVVIPTQSDFSLLVTKPTGATGFEMLNDWTVILHGMKPVNGNGVILPMATIDEVKIDVSSLKGMSTDDPNPWVVQEALMAAKFGLTPAEVKFEAAFAFSARSYDIEETNVPEPGDYVADHALYFALVKRNHWLPLAAGLVDVEDLSDDKTVH